MAKTVISPLLFRTNVPSKSIETFVPEVSSKACWNRYVIIECMALLPI